MPSPNRSDLAAAVTAGIISAEQADRLTQFLNAGTTLVIDKPRFTFVHVLYYLGGMIAIGAMSLFMTLGWNALGGWGGFVTAILYGVGAICLTHKILEKGLPNPAGIMGELAGGLGACAIFWAQVGLGLWEGT